MSYPYWWRVPQSVSQPSFPSNQITVNNMEPGSWLIRGNTGYKIMGDMGSWGVPFVSYPNWCFLIKNLIRNRWFGEGCVFHLFQWLAVIKEMKTSAKKRTQLEKQITIKWQSTNKRGKTYIFFSSEVHELCCSLYIYIHNTYIHTYIYIYIYIHVYFEWWER